MPYKKCKKFNLDDPGQLAEYEELLNDKEKKIYRDQFTWDKKTDSIPYIVVWWEEADF